MSTQPKAPKYQNKFAFAHNPNSKKSQIIMGIPNVGLCQHCHDIIEWRKKFRKYKPIKNLAKCEKKIRSAYHLWCTDCAKGANVCPKCLQNRDIVQAEASALTQEQIQEMLVQVGMKERVRRRIWRLWENSKATDAELKDMILNYNPDAKPSAEEDLQDDKDEDEEAAAKAAAAAAARRGPPPKPKAAAPAPAAVAAAPAASASASAAPAPKAAAAAAPAAEDEEDEDDEDDDDYLDESDGDAEEEAEFQRQLAAKRGPPSKPMQAAPAAASSSSSADAKPIEQALAAASITTT